MSPTLLEQIRDEAVDSTSDLGALLRKCKVLASRLGSQPLEEWLLHESNSYPGDAQVPDYRRWGLEMRGRFSCPGMIMNDARVPMHCLPQEARKHYEDYACRDSVSSIQAALRGTTTTGRYRVSSELAPLLDSVYDRCQCLEAWGIFGLSRFEEVLNSVRNRVLDFALALEKAGITSDALTAKASDAAERVSQIFNMTVIGGVANVVGAANSSTVTFHVQQNDVESLKAALKEHGLADKDVADLEAALQSDPPPVEKDRFGPKVGRWIGKMTTKAADGTWKIGTSAAGGVLAKLISNYYGL